MAEKEERILITTRHKNEKLNMTFTDMYKEYTRQDAIKRIAKALCGDDVMREGYYQLAEAALNALLEE